MKRLANEYADRFNATFGIPQVKPKPGETFDRNNDLTMGDDGRTVYHRDGHVSYGGSADALLTYNKRHMSRRDFYEYYGGADEGCSESMMLHGANG